MCMCMRACTCVCLIRWSGKHALVNLPLPHHRTASLHLCTSKSRLPLNRGSVSGGSDNKMAIFHQSTSPLKVTPPWNYPCFAVFQQPGIWFPTLTPQNPQVALFPSILVCSLWRSPGWLIPLRCPPSSATPSGALRPSGTSQPWRQAAPTTFSAFLPFIPQRVPEQLRMLHTVPPKMAQVYQQGGPGWGGWFWKQWQLLCNKLLVWFCSTKELQHWITQSQGHQRPL